MGNQHNIYRMGVIYMFCLAPDNDEATMFYNSLDLWTDFLYRMNYSNLAVTMMWSQMVKSAMPQWWAIFWIRLDWKKLLFCSRINFHLPQHGWIQYNLWIINCQQVSAECHQKWEAQCLSRSPVSWFQLNFN